jgi:hypothetical protein
LDILFLLLSMRLPPVVDPGLEKWHHIPAGRPIDASEQVYIVQLILSWIQEQCRTKLARPSAKEPNLFAD